MKGKHIIAKLFSVTPPKAKQDRSEITRYSPLLRSRLQQRQPPVGSGEGFAYRSVTACIH